MFSVFPNSIVRHSFFFTLQKEIGRIRRNRFMEEAKIVNLYDLTHTQAAPLLSQW